MGWPPWWRVKFSKLGKACSNFCSSFPPRTSLLKHNTNNLWLVTWGFFVVQ